MPAEATGLSPEPVAATSDLPALPVPGLSGGPSVLALLGAPGTDPTYLPPGARAENVVPFQTFRLVAPLFNGGSDPVTVTPRLEFRVAGTGEFQVVPEAATPGAPLHAAEEWVTTDDGSVPAPRIAQIAVDQLQLDIPDGLTAAVGQRSSGANPVNAYFLAPGTATVQEFTVALSIDAAYGTSYELRVTDDGTAIALLAPATVTVGDVPATLASPGQRAGADVPGLPDPSAADYALVGAPESKATATSYPLYSALASTETAPAAAEDVIVVGPNGPGTIHNPGNSTTSGQCSACHQTHSAKAKALVKKDSETTQCYTCHAGGTGGADVQAQYALGQPTNDPATRSYWSHDTTDSSNHVLDSNNEFKAVLNRHSQCSDCHDPHGASTAKAAMTATGWTAPGGFTKVSGVAVTNGAAGTAPTYTWLDGMVEPVTAEYQLCFKCHSGFTTLPEDVPGKASQNFSDLAVDFNPNNASYHPVEAPGRNQTQKLADSLAGPSPYKLWNFTTNDTMRCVSCHASNTTGTSSDPAENSPDATLTVHASTNRGILIRPYENRVLSKAGQFYDAKGFALCLACHMETPFANRLRPAAAEGTNFVFHGLHVSGITTKGSGGLDIDTPGAGQGNARCAECHFSSHGTTQLPGDQKVAGDRLVGFSPNVLPSKAMGGVPTFKKTATGGNCTLTCHGKDHQGATYSN
ncbi:cytochrome c3 family protein [Intrasporangium calvum]|uniref:Cytochrome c3 family protein n=1 Tax=Intrasporangium calvum TaxID=53358 RepID=A0ABT5GBQ8_9MICO|nr:cytochrome c3 family protein [Intrasporangium calvum]MDC5695712.1 cytochrome c3 family protein [Intrasporangium calvum]